MSGSLPEKLNVGSKLRPKFWPPHREVGHIWNSSRTGAGFPILGARGGVVRRSGIGRKNEVYGCARPGPSTQLALERG